MKAGKRPFTIRFGHVQNEAEDFWWAEVDAFDGGRFTAERCSDAIYLAKLSTIRRLLRELEVDADHESSLGLFDLRFDEVGYKDA